LKVLVEKKGTNPQEAITENNLVLVWCRGDYEYQVKDIKTTIQWLGTDFENEKITGKELEQLFLDLEKDSLAQACWMEPCISGFAFTEDCSRNIKEGAMLINS
jgi:hypothetical protein